MRKMQRFLTIKRFNMSEEKPLAQRCFDSAEVDMELFNKVNEILGCDSEDCLKEGFVWGAQDTYWDNYDGSVEIIRPESSEWMTEEQAQKVHELGFAVIYESKGDECCHWYKGKATIGGAGARKGGEERKFRAKYEALMKEIKSILDDSETVDEMIDKIFEITSRVDEI
jgi:hypothetical protein